MRVPEGRLEIVVIIKSLISNSQSHSLLVFSGVSLDFSLLILCWLFFGPLILVLFRLPRFVHFGCEEFLYHCRPAPNSYGIFEHGIVGVAVAGEGWSAFLRIVKLL